MSSTAERYRSHTGLALFSMGFRPFFLFAALWAAFAVPIWVAAATYLVSAACWMLIDPVTPIEDDGPVVRRPGGR